MKPAPNPAGDAFAFKVIDNRELEKRWHMEDKWALDQTRTRSRDPIPHGAGVCGEVTEVNLHTGPTSKASASDPTTALVNGVAQEYFSIAELAVRWRCSRGTVYNRLRATGANVLDFAQPGKRGKKAVAVRRCSTSKCGRQNDCVS